MRAALARSVGRLINKSADLGPTVQARHLAAENDEFYGMPRVRTFEPSDLWRCPLIAANLMENDPAQAPRVDQEKRDASILTAERKSKGVWPKRTITGLPHHGGERQAPSL
jgi:hypothetical protein